MVTDEFKVFPIVEDVTPKAEDAAPFPERRREWHSPETCFRLLDVQDMVDKIEGRLGDGSERMERIEESIEDQRTRSDRIEHNIKGIRTNLNENTELTRELVGYFKAFKGFFRVAGWIVTGIKWIGGVVVGCVSLYLALKGLEK